MPTPLRLTEAQLDQVFRAARPLHRADRDAFLKAIAHRLSGFPEPGAAVLPPVTLKYFDSPRI
jgi:hypothetical protein